MPGYAHLLSAETSAQVVSSVEPNSPLAMALDRECKAERAALEARIQTSTNKLATQHPDEAPLAMATVRGFAGEYPKIENAFHAIYLYHLELGSKYVTGAEAAKAVDEFKEASDAQPTAEVAKLLAGAQEQAGSVAARQGADAAMTKSQEAEADRDYIAAFEILDALPRGERHWSACSAPTN